MPLARSASATFGCSSSGIGARLPGRGWTELCVTRRSSSRPAWSSSSHGSMSLTTAMGCETRRVLRAAYVDMDGTLLGRGASLFLDADGAFTMLGARALEACARAEVEVVPVLGAAPLDAAARRAHARPASYIFEAGCGMVLDGEVQRLAEEVDDAAANALLLERYAGRLEMYDPWNRGRESSRLYLGRDVDACGGRRTAHRGRVRGAGGWSTTALMHGVDGGGGRAYHLVPRAASKARAVAAHMQARGYVAEEVIAVGDSMRGPRRGRGGRDVLARGERDARGPRRGAAIGERARRRGAERRRRLRGGDHRAGRAALTLRFAAARTGRAREG